MCALLTLLHHFIVIEFSRATEEEEGKNTYENKKKV